MLNIQANVYHLIRKKRLSIRQLAEMSGVRRQSIQGFLDGGGLHLNNLQKILNVLGYALMVQARQAESQSRLMQRVIKRLKVSQKKLKVFCKKNQIRSLSLFGSILAETFSPRSDIDVLIDFDKSPDYFALVQMEGDLKKIFGTQHPIQLVTLRGLSPLLAHEVIQSAQCLYEKAA